MINLLQFPGYIICNSPLAGMTNDKGAFSPLKIISVKLVVDKEIINLYVGDFVYNKGYFLFPFSTVCMHMKHVGIGFFCSQVSKLKGFNRKKNTDRSVKLCITLIHTKLTWIPSETFSLVFKNSV